ncbi:hypothetical protein SKAU_G00272750 [Synaphobranchus kaupii]|uniref:Uncharacterized protein n=1 Tax=Synaphobranchus kaupii TaxID=118154 RepID=A0A9Q1F0X9_SYNKA|nr:hypothetical protein SKAU_G00272750 [Synaphobranchus kaupii]
MYTGLLITGIVVGIYIFVYNAFIKRRRCKSSAKLHGKTAIITGANTGIGKATALDLARRGARVILACRNQQRAEAAVSDIKRESGNDEVVYMQLNLASLQSVRSFTETFLKTRTKTGPAHQQCR